MSQSDITSIPSIGIGHVEACIRHLPIQVAHHEMPHACQRWVISTVAADAINQWPGETDRRWVSAIAMSEEVKKRVDALWRELGL